MARALRKALRATAPFAQRGAVRGYFASAHLAHGSDEHLEGQPLVSVVFELSSGETTATQGRVGESLLRVAQRHGVPLEGACECSIACSTCHVILDEDHFDSLEYATEEEDDMLDMAFGLTETSRLGCQCVITADMDNTTVQLPAATRNFYVDGHVPQPH